MRARARWLQFIAAISVILISACGNDSSPTGSTRSSGFPTSSTGPMGLASTNSDGMAQLTSVGQILDNPGAFIGQEVQLQGRVIEPIDEVRFLFTDGTGEIRLQFPPEGPFPLVDVAIDVFGMAASGMGDIVVKIDVGSFGPLPEFSCEEILDVRARFTDPGFSFGNVVGYYLAFRGVAPGEKVLEMNWGDGNVEEASLGAGNLRGDGLFDLEGVVGYEYPDVRGQETKTVRATLRILGRGGQCSRVRDVAVTPGSGPGFAGGGTISVSVDEGDSIRSGSVFSVRGKVENKATSEKDVSILFETPARSTLIPESVNRCDVLDAELVECVIEGLKPGEKLTRVVKYRAPAVSNPLEITGHVALVSGEFKPVAQYRMTVQP
jgi:uncharacterized protein YdeI (BOF family)